MSNFDADKPAEWTEGLDTFRELPKTRIGIQVKEGHPNFANPEVAFMIAYGVKRETYDELNRHGMIEIVERFDDGQGIPDGLTKEETELAARGMGRFGQPFLRSKWISFVSGLAQQEAIDALCGLRRLGQ